MKSRNIFPNKAIIMSIIFYIIIINHENLVIAYKLVPLWYSNGLRDYYSIKNK